MDDLSDRIDRMTPTRRPPGRPAGYQCWSELLFVHWRLPAEVVRPLLPQGLTLDTWEGNAWVGLVPFRMSRVRPWWSPPVPGISWFLETNVRTYVHWRGRDPGVWFFSLEASNALAVRLARWGWHLPYFHARMSLWRSGAEFRYSSHRHADSDLPAGCDIVAEVAAPFDFRLGDAGAVVSEPGTLEHFLVDRYLLYAQDSAGVIWRGQVHHAPYRWRRAVLRTCSETLLKAASIPAATAPCHALFSDGVRVAVYPLKRVDVATGP